MYHRISASTTIGHITHHFHQIPPQQHTETAIASKSIHFTCKNQDSCILSSRQYPSASQQVQRLTTLPILSTKFPPQQPTETATASKSIHFPYKNKDSCILLQPSTPRHLFTTTLISILLHFSTKFPLIIHLKLFSSAKNIHFPRKFSHSCILSLQHVLLYTTVIAHKEDFLCKV